MTKVPAPTHDLDPHSRFLAFISQPQQIPDLFHMLPPLSTINPISAENVIYLGGVIY